MSAPGPDGPGADAPLQAARLTWTRPAPREKPATAVIRGRSQVSGDRRNPRYLARLRPSESVDSVPGVALKVAARVRIPLGVLSSDPGMAGETPEIPGVLTFGGENTSGVA